jgi:phosphate:Na+ symporter
MLALIERAFDVMIENLNAGYTRLHDIANAYDAEHAINECRDNLREGNLLNLGNNAYSYLVGVYFMDIIGESERVGDFIINVSESIMEIKS